MAAITSPPPMPHPSSNDSPGPPIPSPGTIARRGRRPALIPYSADLSAYLASNGSFHPSFHISPFGTVLGATLSSPSNNTTRAPLFVLPPSSPDGSSAKSTTQLKWRMRSNQSPDNSPFAWNSEGESDEDFEIVQKGGRKRAISSSNSGRKAQLRRSLLFGSMDKDAMEVDDDERKEVEGDVFSWVNSSCQEDYTFMPLPNLASLNQLPSALSKNHLQPIRPRKLNLAGMDNAEDGNPLTGTWTVPTSPMSGAFGADLEMQRKRLQEAGIGIERAVSGMEGIETA
ncbi:hypothetical protein BDZ91DRAFT_793773 [Kalaharituber pfeilii]|nr:hypothetical protein BDZ91DRAFT_793773 [Kalaharituber pfeilii]